MDSPTDTMLGLFNSLEWTLWMGYKFIPNDKFYWKPIFSNIQDQCAAWMTVMSKTIIILSQFTMSGKTKHSIAKRICVLNGEPPS